MAESHRAVPKYDAWDELSLEYAVPWPLGLLFTRDALRRYDEMFKYLLRLRRAAAALDGAWVTLRRVAAGAATTTPGALRAEEEREARRRRRLRFTDPTSPPDAAEACQRARRDVAFLVQNWLTYLQTDVVEARFSEMMDKIDAMTAKNDDDDDDDDDGVDFGEAQRAHRAFLAALGAQSFLDLPSVTQSVEATLAMARTVCGAIETLPLDGSPHPDEARVAAEMERAREAFEATSRGLYDTLRSDRLAGDPKAPYLRRLLLRLNFNGFVGEKADAARGREKAAGRATDAEIGGGSVADSAAPSARSSLTSLAAGRRGWGASDSLF
jgi:gamma-tubulin complex component 4